MSTESRYRRAAGWIGLGVAGVAVVVLAGWVLGVPEVASIRSGWPAMSINTALLLGLAGLSLNRRASEPRGHSDRLAMLAAIAVVAGVALTAGQYALALAPSSGRMSPATGAVLLGIGIGLLLIDFKAAVSRFLAVFSGVVAMVPIVGWGYGWRAIEDLTGYRQMAIHTAVCGLALAAGLLCARPLDGFTRVLAGETNLSRTIRRLAAASLVVPVGAGWLFHSAVRAGMIGSTSALALFAISTMLVLATLAIIAGLFLTRAESEREVAEAAIAESAQRFKVTFEQAAVGIAHVAPDGRWLRVNRRLCEIVGYTQEELLKKTFQDITHPEDLDADLALVKQVLAGVIDTYSIEKRYFRTDCSIVWINLTVSLVRAPDGSPKYFISVVEDIGERKRATELMHKYARELERSNKELQEFAFVASHDLQEPLRKIVAFGRQLQDSAAGSLDSQSHEALSRMIGAAARMSRLIEGVLDLSRVATQAGVFEAISIRVPVMEALQDLDGRIQETGAVIDVGELPVVEADRLQMKRLFTNLLSNALKFVRSGHTPHVRIASDGTAGGLCRISVVDNGIGFDEKYAEKVFTPFQRLHGPLKYEGSGMGLAICRKIVTRHGGSIAVMSKPGDGSTFTITLPARQAEMGRTV